jgi:hypothetical protein
MIFKIRGEIKNKNCNWINVIKLVFWSKTNLINHWIYYFSRTATELNN